MEEPTTNKVVDADGHVVEPMAAWAEIPTQLRPTVERDQSGYEHVVVGGQEILAAPLGTLATPGSHFGTQTISVASTKRSRVAPTRCCDSSTWTRRASINRCSTRP